MNETQCQRIADLKYGMNFTSCTLIRCASPCCATNRNPSAQPMVMTGIPVITVMNQWIRSQCTLSVRVHLATSAPAGNKTKKPKADKVACAARSLLCELEVDGTEVGGGNGGADGDGVAPPGAVAIDEVPITLEDDDGPPLSSFRFFVRSNENAPASRCCSISAKGSGEGDVTPKAHTNC